LLATILYVNRLFAYIGLLQPRSPLKPLPSPAVFTTIAMPSFKPNKTLVRSIILTAVVLIIAIVVSKMLNKPKGDNGVKISFRTKSVEAIVAQPTSIPIEVFVSGKLKSKQRMDLFSEVNGRLLNSSFRAGRYFASGQTIASLDDAEFRAQLVAQRSGFMGQISQVLADISLDYPTEFETWKGFLEAIDPKKRLPELPKISNPQLKQFISGRNILSTYYNIKSQEVRLTKYSITAPYSGVLSEAAIDPGTLVRAGQKLGTFVRQGSYELEAEVTRNVLEYLQPSQKVKLYSEELNASFIGTVTRVNTIVNPNTQLVSVFLTVNDAKLQEGTYLTATIKGSVVNNALKINRNLISNNGSVFIIQSDSTLQSTPVEVITYVEDQAIVTGIEAGSLLPRNAIATGFDGMKVQPQTAKEAE
jgi:membrane fusion protein (multidrug efflux system)